jgi:hypothetical protein
MSRSGRALLGVLALVPPSTVDALDQPLMTDSPPTVVIEAPLDGGFSQPGEPLSFKVSVTDDVDTVDCTRVVVTYDGQVAAVGPDCTGVLTPAAEGHTFSARYTDSGASTGTAEVMLNPREQLAPSGYGAFQQPPEFVVPHVNLAGINHIAMELAAMGPGATMTVHADMPDGAVVASFPAVPETGQYQWLAADVTDPVGVHDLYFVANGVSARYLRFQTVPAVTASVSPGWYTTEVPVTVSTAPLWDPQVSLDGGATWVPAPAVLSAEGAYDLRYRAVDVAGRTTEVGATAVRIDRTAPVVPVTREHPHSTILELAATDAGSGVATFAATLDGAPVTGPVELWRYPAGVHQLTVTATDVAGNTATQTRELAITTSLAELTPLMTRFPVPFVKSVILRLQLMAAQHAVDEGRTAEAVTWVKAFLRSASVLRDPAARTTLTADAAAVVTQLSGS